MIKHGGKHARRFNVRARLVPLISCLLGALTLCALSCSAEEKDVVINEIMYHPPKSRDDLQFVELFNRGTTEVNLAGWTFRKGIQFSFPPGSKLGPGRFLVVCRDPVAFSTQYGTEPAKVGPFTGRLSHRSERLELANAQGQLIDGIKYADSENWARGADGYSSSLERICPFADGERPENWAASNSPQKKGAAGSPGRQNDVFSTNLPPVVTGVEFIPKVPAPSQPVQVTATIADDSEVKTVALVWRVAGSGRETQENVLAMTRASGDEKRGTYQATIPAQGQGQLVRFRIHAANSLGTERFLPAPNEPRPTFSYFTFGASANGTIPQAYVLNIGRPERGPGHYERTPARRPSAPVDDKPHGALLYVPAEGGVPETFDYVRVIIRHGGYKIHFQKDRPLKGMTGINVISEGPARWLVSEPLSYSVYRMAGVPTPLTEHLRLTMDGRMVGYQLLVEQPNKSFLSRNGRSEGGNLYKLIWYGQGVIGQHEKKTNPGTGHADLVELIQGLRRKSGADQWAFIEKNFNVDECINYYVVNMCIQNWDGFFNNYFAYHDTTGTGKWEIYPWDEDKTWGDYDGASPNYDWYEMPLTFGMNGDRPARDIRVFGGGPFGGVSWWRPAGYFSGPLLANPEFRKRFLSRLKEFCTNDFTEANLLPIIDATEKRLEPEVRLRAQATGQSVSHAQREFASDMKSFRSQVQNRRKFILNELAKARQ